VQWLQDGERKMAIVVKAFSLGSSEARERAPDRRPKSMEIAQMHSIFGVTKHDIPEAPSEFGT
jgi:hypothetical protein